MRAAGIPQLHLRSLCVVSCYVDMRGEVIRLPAVALTQILKQMPLSWVHVTLAGRVKEPLRIRCRWQRCTSMRLKKTVALHHLADQRLKREAFFFRLVDDGVDGQCINRPEFPRQGKPQ